MPARASWTIRALEGDTERRDVGPGQAHPGPADPVLPGDYEETECRTDTDCDPSGQLFCDYGYCVW